MTKKQFDPIVSEYISVKEKNPIIRYCQKLSLLQVLGDISGQAILDVGCGYGYYARLLKEHKVSKVVGVDISAKMVEKAQQIENKQALGVIYKQYDVTQMQTLGQFDLVLAVQMFNSFDTVEKLEQLFISVYRHLKPNGRFIALMPNPSITMQDLTRYTSYGISLNAPFGLDDGAKLTTVIQGDDVLLTFEDYHWTQDTFDNLLAKTGFKRVIWHPMVVSDEGIAALGQTYWQPFLEKPRSVILEAFL